MPDRYISDEQVIINTQGLRTVRREDKEVKGCQPHRLMWSYKGQEHYHAYSSHAARDAMYNALRKALTAEKEQMQPGGYNKIAAIKVIRGRLGQMGCMTYGVTITDATALIEALEPIMRPGRE